MTTEKLESYLAGKWSGGEGNGEELGGLNGLRLYHQRVAVQGSAELLAEVQSKAATLQ